MTSLTWMHVAYFIVGWSAGVVSAVIALSVQDWWQDRRNRG